MQPDGRVAQIKISTGRRLDGGLVEVVDGLSKGALVVASGAGFLNDGDMVKTVAALPKATTQAAKPAAAASAP